MICVESESALAGRSAEAQQPQRHSIIAGPPLNTALTTSLLLSLHRSASPHPLFSARTELRGRGLPQGSVSRAPRQLVGGECATCVRHGRGGGGLGALLGTCWAWVRRSRAGGGVQSLRRLCQVVSRGRISRLGETRPVAWQRGRMVGSGAWRRAQRWWLGFGNGRWWRRWRGVCPAGLVGGSWVYFP